jgi:hypothetical protein
MCPECISTAAMLTAGVSSAGGVGALVLSKLRGKKRSNIRANQLNEQTEPATPPFSEWVVAFEALGKEAPSNNFNQPEGEES